MDGSRPASDRDAWVTRITFRLRTIVLVAASLGVAVTLNATERRTAEIAARRASSGQTAVNRTAAESPDLDRIKHADEAVQPQLKYAFNLADRGAVYSANARYLDCLRTISKILDAGQRVPTHEQALFLGLTAMREADDFVQATPGTTINMERTVVVHKTPILKATDFSKLTPADALRRYYYFAQRQLTLAGDKVPAASRALYGMGRIEAYRSSRDGLTTAAGSAKALLLHQAALAVDSENYAAANEIGVLLARGGHFDAARKMFEHSIKVQPEPETWHNLGEVCDKLGEDKKALLAKRKAESLTNAQHETDRGEESNNIHVPAVRWVDSKEFAANGVASDCTYNLRTAAAPAASAKAAPAAKKVAEGHRSESRIGRAWSSLRERISSRSQGGGQTKSATEARDSHDRVNR
jgi:tetratricopeptide (TPR) repeat protein